MRLRNFLNENNYSEYTDVEMLREAIKEEWYASNLYSKMAQKAKNPDVKKILLHVSDEEEHHIGEFEHLLKQLDKDYESNRLDGEQEAKEEIGEM